MASRGGAQEQLAKRLFARARFRAWRPGVYRMTAPSSLLVGIAWRLVDPVTRTRFRARAREALADRRWWLRGGGAELELDVNYGGA